MRTVDGQRVAFAPERATARKAADKATKQRANCLKRLGNFDVTEKDWNRVHAEQAALFERASSVGLTFVQDVSCSFRTRRIAAGRDSRQETSSPTGSPTSVTRPIKSPSSFLSRLHV